MPKSDSLWILALALLLPDLVNGRDDQLWFLQPPSKNQVLNGTETRIHCQLNKKAEQVSGQNHLVISGFCPKLNAKY